MTTGLLLTGGMVATPDSLVRADVLVKGTAIEALIEPPATGINRPDTDTVDCSGTYIVPGFVDMHVHGADGQDFSDGEIDTVTAYHGRHGTTSMVASLAFLTPDTLVERAGVIAHRPEMTRGAQLAGIHYESPFLDHTRRGAHDEHNLREPDVALAERMCAAAGRHGKVVTIAPELPGARDVMRVFAANGFLVALGHSNATVAQARQGFADGGRHVTHLANGMRPLHHREPGLAGAVLDDDAVTAELIGDGLHVRPSVMRMFYRLLGRDRLALITDAAAPCGSPDGEYRLGGDRRLTVVDGLAYVEGEGEERSIAGSTATMEDALRTATTGMRLPLVDAVHLVSTTPARLLGLPDRGRIAPGLRADLCLLDADQRVRSVLIGGRWAREPRLPGRT